jgi:eukaryotic-like serine/threonine-protein kinase
MGADELAAGGEDGGLVAGRYELGPVIGTGSAADVHRARDLLHGIDVALKRFRAGASPHDLRQQRREMEALAYLDHPGLVRLHDGGTDGGRPFVVTDLVEGPTLAERIAAGPPLAPGVVRRLGAQLAGALAHVHAAGIVHRDVKPANVLLGDGNRPRLADFGISRTADTTSATADGCVVGTAAYLAPEQARGEKVGPAADIYSLGLVLLEALTGRREFPGLAVESATARLHRSPVIPEGLHGVLGAVLAAMTRDDPGLRPSAAAVATVLAADPASASAQMWPGVYDASPRRRSGRHRRHPVTRRRVTSRFALVALTGSLAMLAAAAAPAGSPAAAPTAPVTTAAEAPNE